MQLQLKENSFHLQIISGWYIRFNNGTWHILALVVASKDFSFFFSAISLQRWIIGWRSMLLNFISYIISFFLIHIASMYPSWKCSLFAILVKFWAQSHSCLKELWPKLFLYCTSAQVRIPHQSMEAMLGIGMLRFRRQCRSCLYAPIIGNVAVAGCLYAPTASSRPQKTHVGLFTAIVGIVGLWRDIVLG